ncbi:MAG: DUF1624 domain-containing protein [Ignavibacteriae bacterium]|nr:DUF1624 domain-containing protein [Ignavibacteriota bacterium]
MSELPLPTPPARKRVEYIDLLRGWAVIVMIETHMMNATISPEIMSSSFFIMLTFINGLVAPSFTFASGLAYAVTTRRKINDYLAFGAPLLLNIRRLLFVVGIGYLLHLPKFNFHQILTQTTARSWEFFFQADVLQCIGVSLLIIQGLLLMLRSERRLYVTLSIMAFLVVFLSPIVWGIDWRNYLPPPVAGYMNGMHFPQFSGFPLFPWSAFIFGGAALGYFALEAKQKGNEQKFFMQVLWIAPAVMLFSALIEPTASRLYPTYHYGLSSPSFFLLRFGIVMLLCGGMFFFEKRFSVSPKSIVTLIGRESLIVYSLHLLLIYGNFASFNFQKRVAHSFGYLEASIATVVLIGLMILVAKFWDHMRKRNPKVKQRIQWAVALGLVLVFFFGPGE